MMTDAPKRIQRRRAKGWRLPEGAVIVDRTTKWGNPFVIGEDGTAAECVKLYLHLLGGLVCLSSKAPVERQQAARRHVCEHISELRGKDLACWCAPGKPCHGDILLKIANRD